MGNQVKILRIKQGLDELSDLLDGLKNCDIDDGINQLLANEIMVRLQTIQSLDRHFRGIQMLIEEAKESQGNPQKSNSNTNVKDETEFKKKLIKMGRLIRMLNSRIWYSHIKPEKLRQHINDVKLLRCEKIFQFHSDLANDAVEKKNAMLAKEQYYHIQHALKGSGLNSHPRIIELIEQTEFMSLQVTKTIANKLQQEEKEAQEASEVEEKTTEPTPDAQARQ
ncbi:hypothetical protein [sulfur-oxidizing endosymbiont of Gigantopelta aegis]|uniref:hypothetical protein n=1 Tax=sulfur-oxidizing endosymbiont of Gigantopelta aegis TaxID=2794934 RepID=UPI0018DC3711|nr:hypothetical protein [sulfur-oxidizing endosymbiont of Gigantopelta aegis]